MKSFILFRSIPHVGEIWYTYEDGNLDVYTRSFGYGDFVFQFGLAVPEEYIDRLITANYENENLWFECD